MSTLGARVQARGTMLGRTSAGSTHRDVLVGQPGCPREYIRQRARDCAGVAIAGCAVRPPGYRRALRRRIRRPGASVPPDWTATIYAPDPVAAPILGPLLGVAASSHCDDWSGRRDLNSGPLPPQGSALPGCATARLPEISSSYPTGPKRGCAHAVERVAECCALKLCVLAYDQRRHRRGESAGA